MSLTESLATNSRASYLAPVGISATVLINKGRKNFCFFTCTVCAVTARGNPEMVMSLKLSKTYPKNIPRKCDTPTEIPYSCPSGQGKGYSTKVSLVHVLLQTGHNFIN